MSQAAVLLSPPRAGAAGAGLLRRAVDAAYAQRQRTTALRWSAVNGVLLAVFAYDLSCKCPGYTSALHWAELALAGALCCALARHVRHLLPASAPPPQPLTPAQCRLLGLQPASLDSSFCLVEEDSLLSQSSHGGGGGGGGSECEQDSQLSLSLSLSGGSRGGWRDASAAPSPSPPRAPSPAADLFIADRGELRQYLEACARAESPPPAGAGAPLLAARDPPPRYQLAQPHSPERSEGGGEAAEAGGSPRLWWRVHLDPRHLTQFNLNLRLWIQVTILERLVREIDAADEALARHGLASFSIGEVSGERLRALAAVGGGGGEAARRVRALLPFLAPLADQRYAVRRVRELARGGCLSAYRWNGGGAGWDETRPTDAELVLSLVAAYLDCVLPAPPARPFSSAHLSEAPAPPPPLGLHRVRARPPHYAACVDGAALEPAAGRNNLWHALLLLLAALARRRPPPARLHRAGLNVLWIIGKE